MKPPSYLRSTLQPGEIVIFKGTIHPAYLVAPVLWTLLIIAMILKSIFIFHLVDDGSRWFWALLILPAVYFIQHIIIFLTSETALTSHRVLSKTGLISRNISEITLGKIESSSVDQGIIGRIFGFGDLIVHGSGGHSATGTAISKVMAFRAAVQNATNGH